MAGKVKLPVTLLAKWKTVLQMTALAVLQLALAPLWTCSTAMAGEPSSIHCFQPLRINGPFKR